MMLTYIYRNLKISTIFSKISNISTSRKFNFFPTRLWHYTKFSLSRSNNFSEKDIDISLSQTYFFRPYPFSYYPISIKIFNFESNTSYLSKIYSHIISHSQLMKRDSISKEVRKRTVNLLDPTCQLRTFLRAGSQWRNTERRIDIRCGDNLQSVGQIIPYNVFTLSSFDSGKRRGNRATAVGRHCLPIP